MAHVRAAAQDELRGVPHACGQAGVEEVRWQQPVRPGDRLHVRRQTLAKRPGEGGKSQGEVEFLYEVINRDGVVAMTQRSLLLLEQRPLLFGN
jgi:acyl dehydratase